MIKSNKRPLNKLIQATLILAISTYLLSCNNNYRVKESSSQMTFITDSLATIPEIDKYIAPYTDSLEQEMNKVIGHCEQQLTKGMPESLLTNFTADLMLSSTNNFCSNNPDFPSADIAIINYKGLRTAIEKGDIMVKNIFNLMPFENEIILVTLNKQQVIELFDFMASVGGDGLSGASFVIADKKATNIKVNNKALEEKNYIIATSDYLANGGDHFTIFKDGAPNYNTKLKVRDVIIDHISDLHTKNISINSQLDKRISYATK
ncbi:5'-nucleotidase C-terminal domain-containing protein [Carboxylicivirga sp. N1Y90]|uniref:5'-nucleotidase C-terminal domain-containing protein n=1 Tax=Carboxylicivirga fragile TaxID=3417571 RepID=UPI003D35716E|nr:5'-nucleotidase C-terminal domain-containing protein [Marinilabiliaceae bacterium N1Y90]